jgi:predicted nucleic acid-binding protein
VSRVYWDSMLFIYWFEEHPQYAARTLEILDRMHHRKDELCTSVFTLGEVLVLAKRRGDHAAESTILEYLQPPLVEILPFTHRVADQYARLRADHRISPADAIHIACACEAGVDLFLTNDRALHRLTIPGIDFIAGLDVNLF